VQRARLSNISVGGFLAVTAVSPPKKLLDHRVSVDLRFDGPHSAWSRLSGRVLRIDGNKIAIALDDVPAAFQLILAEMSSSAHHRRRVLSVVLVDATGRRRVRMAEAFRAAGCAVIEVATPLEAIVRLGEASFEPDLIAIADSAPTSTSEELRLFVEDAHPDAKLVTIGDDVIERVGLANWLSAATPQHDMASTIRDVLTRPARR